MELERVLLNLFAGQQWRHRHGERLMDTGSGKERRGWGRWTEKHGNTYTAAASLQSCLILCDPMYSSPPGSSVHRIL